MPFNLLLFPIIGGYYVLIRSELFRYEQQRVDTQKLILNSILVGIVLLGISWILTSVVRFVFPQVVDVVTDYYPIKVNYFGTAISSFLLGITLTELSNLFVTRASQIPAAIKSIGNEFERLCEFCYSNGELIQLSLRNNKCYVGWVQSLPIPSHDEYIRIFPVYSGYRKDETKELVFTTQYLDVYAKYVQEGEVTDIEELTTLVIRIDEVISSNLFRPEMYQRFSSKSEEGEK